MNTKLWTGAILAAAAATLTLGCGDKGANNAQPAADNGGAAADPAAGNAGAADPAAGNAGAAAPAKQGWGPKPAPPGWDKKYLPPNDNWKKFKQELVFNNGADIETLDPAVVTGVPEHRIFMAVYESMVIHDPETTEPRPGVAETWSVSDDGKVYTFTLRKDAKWSNGAPVTADDFRYAWYRVLSPYPASQYAYMLHDIKGAKAFTESKQASPYTGGAFDDVGIKVVDPQTLEVTLESPKAYFLDILAHQTAMPVHRATVEPFDKEKKSDQAFRLEHFVGNGTHKLAELEPRKHILLTKSDTYWNKANVFLEKITALPIESQETAYNKFQADELHWMLSVPLSKIDEVKQLPDYYVAPYLGTYYYRINCTQREHPDKPGTPHPLTDPRVRKALNLAINKETICEKVLKGGQIPASGFVPPGIPGYPTFQGLEYDRAKARELLAEAGYPGGKGFPKVEILYNTLESHKKVAEAIGGMWEETLGIVIGLSNTEWKVYLDQVDRVDYDISRAGWIGDYGDPNTFLDMWVKDGGNNNTNWFSEEYDTLYKKTMTTGDPVERMKAFQRMEEIICKEAFPVIPVYYYVNQGLKKFKVQGVYENIRDLHPWQYIWIEDEE